MNEDKIDKLADNSNETAEADEGKRMGSPERRRHRGIYLLPNLFTTGCLFAGFYAIVAAMGGHFESAAVAIFIAMILDGLDGRVARMTNTQSAFGAEYDSLADMVSFGLAPALVVYVWALSDLGKLGWLGAFIYTAGTALRLARFNTQVGSADKRYFQGLASPAAAAVVAGMVWVGHDYQAEGLAVSILATVVTVCVGLLMVSNVRYRSFKDLDLKGKVPFVAILAVVLVFVLVSLDPPQVLLAGFAVYAFSGPVGTLWSLRRRRAERKAQSDQDESAD
ncbi:MAG: CDP-diacylglycerol--serine O-phosphatidyltransferase [Gammaproteobacteria bacterium]|nr:CDP-diacylglycerol--serine O-phosphatidyltransferase [Gammaproteobacteria bacterium]MCF6261237.1 CDP-diacylglycerol--serine O-phosphatidyltransferase [Gammaproteobacteria bacterium]